MSGITGMNSELFLKGLQSKINEGLMAAAEPLIQEAVKKIEVELRQKLASMGVGMIDSSYSVERAGHIVTIRVALPEKNRPY